MAKKPAAPAAKKEAPAKPAAEKKKKRPIAERTMIKFLKMPDTEAKDTKFAPQLVGCVTCAKSFGTASRKDVLAKLPEFIETSQAHNRIWQHYQNDMVEGGFISISVEDE